jgi:hypothetical protein
MKLEKPFPEIGCSTDPKQVPWAKAVVWSERMETGQRVYEWLTKEHIRGLNWSTGTLSVNISHDSYLDKDVMYFLISAPFIAIGKDVTV